MQVGTRDNERRAKNTLRGVEDYSTTIAQLWEEIQTPAFSGEKGFKIIRTLLEGTPEPFRQLWTTRWRLQSHGKHRGHRQQDEDSNDKFLREHLTYYNTHSQVNPQVQKLYNEHSEAQVDIDARKVEEHLAEQDKMAEWPD